MGSWVNVCCCCVSEPGCGVSFSICCAAKAGCRVLVSAALVNAPRINCLVVVCSSSSSIMTSFCIDGGTTDVVDVVGRNNM